MHNTDTVEIDSIRGTQADAVRLMIHHLHLAQRLFEALDETQEEEQRRIIEAALHAEPAARVGALAFFDALTGHYNTLAREQ